MNHRNRQLNASIRSLRTRASVTSTPQRSHTTPLYLMYLYFRKSTPSRAQDRKSARKEPVSLGLECPVIDRFGFSDFAMRPRAISSGWQPKTGWNQIAEVDGRVSFLLSGSRKSRFLSISMVSMRLLSSTHSLSAVLTAAALSVASSSVTSMA